LTQAVAIVYLQNVGMHCSVKTKNFCFKFLFKNLKNI